MRNLPGILLKGHRPRQFIFGSVFFIMFLLFIVAPTALAANRIGYYKMNGNFNDQEGNNIVGWWNKTAGESPSSIVSWVSGYNGQAARTTHADNNDLIGIIDDDWLRSHGVRSLYIRFRLFIESSYPTFSNFKLFRSDSPYIEMSIRDATTQAYTIDTVLNSSSGFGWNEGTDYVKNPKWVFTLRNQWILVEIYCDAHTSNGDAWLKLKGLESKTETSQYTPNAFHATDSSWGRVVSSPSIKASGNGGWWRIDEYEIWDGIPDGQPPEDYVSAPSAPTGLKVLN